MSRRELSFYTPPSIFNKICACSCTRIHKVLTVIYSFMFKTLQLQRCIKCLIITRYDLKFIGIYHQLIVTEWLVLVGYKPQGFGFESHCDSWRFSRYICLSLCVLFLQILTLNYLMCIILIVAFRLSYFVQFTIKFLVAPFFTLRPN
jgi:hypothetical protein